MVVLQCSSTPLGKRYPTEPAISLGAILRLSLSEAERWISRMVVSVVPAGFTLKCPVQEDFFFPKAIDSQNLPTRVKHLVRLLVPCLSASCLSTLRRVFNCLAAKLSYQTQLHGPSAGPSPEISCTFAAKAGESSSKSAMQSMTIEQSGVGGLIQKLETRNARGTLYSFSIPAR